MGESTAPFGENVKKRSASKKIFELTTASPTDFFTHSSLLYLLSKVKVFAWWSNIMYNTATFMWSLRWEIL
jgi:hypothetical protein